MVTKADGRPTYECGQGNVAGVETRIRVLDRKSSPLAQYHIKEWSKDADATEVRCFTDDGKL